MKNRFGNDGLSRAKPSEFIQHRVSFLTGADPFPTEELPEA
jgi:hypothetical protein